MPFAVVGFAVDAVVTAVAFVGAEVAAAGAFVGAELGVGAAVGSGIVGAGIGAGLGAGEAAIFGGDPGLGALTGGISGGALGGLGGASGLVAEQTGLGAIGSDALIGAGTGAINAGITGSDPFTGALTGGATAGAFGALGEFSGSGGFGGTGATFSDSLTPATFGSPGGGGAIDAGTFDVPALGGGVSGASGAPAVLADIGGAGGAVPGATVGAPAFTPPEALAGGGGQSLDFTQATQGTPGSVFTGTTDSGTSTVAGVSPDISQSDAAGIAQQQGSTFTPGSDPSVQAEVADVGLPPGEPRSLLQRIGGGLDTAAGKVGSFVENNPLQAAGIALTGGSLLKSLAAPNQVPGISQLQGISEQQRQSGQSLIDAGNAARTAPALGATDLAGTAARQGTTLTDYINNGTLPPGVQTQVDQATQAAIAKIRGDYAARGMSGSSSETQDINSAKQRGVSQGTQIALALLQQGQGFETLAGNLYNSLIGQSNTLLQTGASLIGGSAQTTSALVNANIAQNNQVNTAIGNLGRALSGGSLTNTRTVTADAAA
jgi:hypothetical protein